ncbi:DUF1501 domain-containing protein [Isosphaeraceae bacterium EP7]
MIRFIARREFLRIGGLTGLGFGLAGMSGAADSGRGPGFGKAKSVLLVYANGGQSQLETWDPKPDAPREIRGEFAAIRSAVPGTFLGEHLPGLARRADKYTLIRSVSHEDLDHGSATYLALTGRYHPQRSGNPSPAPTDFPVLGALLGKVRPGGPLPHPSVHVNGPALVPELPGPGQDAGFLGGEFDPLLVKDPADGSPLPVGLGPVGGDALRIQVRRSLLESVTSAARGLKSDRTLDLMDAHYRRAYEMIDSPVCRTAFDLSLEPESVRNRYGRHRSGQACLLGRRLVEAGVPLVTVFWNQSARGQDRFPGQIDAYGWDTHNDIFQTMRDHLLPRFDRSMSALLDDLDQSGLLETTLVVCMGEFGRAPLVALEPKFDGATPGRKHWAGAYSILMAGAGVSRGKVYGASDRFAAYPAHDAVGPWDIAATIWSALGIDPTYEYLDPLNRPFALCTGQPIKGIYGG